MLSVSPIPLPSLPGATVIQDNWRCPGSEPPGAAPRDSDGKTSTPDSSSHVEELLGMLCPHRLPCDDGNVL